MSFLLDTNVISEMRKGRQAHPKVLRWMQATPASSMFLSVLVLGEIRCGIERKRLRDPAQGNVLESWLENVRAKFGARILGLDERVAEQWGRLSALRSTPSVDGLLAATALVHGLTLVTRNVSDIAFTGVQWLDPFLG